MRYRKQFSGALRRYFSASHAEDVLPEALPSFSGFRRALGISLCDFERFLTHKDFAAAVAEAREARRDLLKLGALEKRFDPSFVKYLLDEGESDGDAFSVEIGEV